MRKIIVGLFVLGFAGVGAGLWTSHAAEEPAKQTEEKGPAGAEAGGECCKAGDTTPPTELVDKIPQVNCIVPTKITPSSRRRRTS